MSICAWETQIIRYFLAAADSSAMIVLEGDEPLGEAAAAALDAAPEFDIAANIAGLIEAGAFISLACGDPS